MEKIWTSIFKKSYEKYSKFFRMLSLLKVPKGSKFSVLDFVLTKQIVDSEL